MGAVVSLDSESGKDMADRDGGNALDRLLALVADDFAKVDRAIHARMSSEVTLIPELGGYIIASGGKRLRPLLLIAAARMCGYRGGDRHAKLAACVEFIHTATLLHDDVVDESALRRGRATANVVWSNQSSVLVGDFLFARAFEVMTSDGSLPVLAVLSKASAVIAEGEVMQLQTANNLATTEAVYLTVIAAKTAALFAAAARIGALVAGRPATEEVALENFGRNLGVAFQLIDDVLDYSANQARLGKTVGDDFREGKITLPVIVAYHRGTSEERAFWERCMERLEQTPEDLEQAQTLIEAHGALEEAISRARDYGERARDDLARFPATPEREALAAVIDFCIERAY